METAKGARKAGFDVVVDRDMNIKYDVTEDFEVYEQTYEDVVKESDQLWHEFRAENPDIHMIKDAPASCGNSA